MSVHRKLMEARVRLQQTELKKSGENKFAGYKYFEIGDFIPAVQQIFLELGLSGIVSYGKEVATLTICDFSDSGQTVEITSPMSEAALKGCHPVQNLGAVETYIRRYLWVTALEIVEHDAIDSTSGKAANASPAAIKQDAYAALDDDAKAWIDNLAMQVVMLLEGEGAEQANAHISESLGNPDNLIELKSALWHRLDSKTRSALKKK